MSMFSNMMWKNGCCANGALGGKLNWVGTGSEIGPFSVIAIFGSIRGV